MNIHIDNKVKYKDMKTNYISLKIYPNTLKSIKTLNVIDESSNIITNTSTLIKKHGKQIKH